MGGNCSNLIVFNILNIHCLSFQAYLFILFLEGTGVNYVFLHYSIELQAFYQFTVMYQGHFCHKNGTDPCKSAATLWKQEFVV